MRYSSGPPTDPKEPEYRHEEHAFSMDTEVTDAPGKGLNEEFDFTVFTVLHREYSCDRDGCDAETTERMLFAMEDVYENHKREADDFNEREVNSVALSAEIVDYNILQVTTKTGTVEVESRTKRTSGGNYACNGEPERINYR